jgi:hypothetical protein
MADAAVAIYWDFENVHACLVDDMHGDGTYRSGRFKPQDPVVDIDPVAEYAAAFGRIVVHRAYANWQYFGRYRLELQSHAMELVQMFPLAGAKNGADIRLVLDVAEDLQYQQHVTHVVVVASDSDYTSLALRCRKQGRVFVGIGTDRTAESYQFACDEFRRYRDLAVSSSSAPSAAAADGPEPLEEAAGLVIRALRRLAAGSGETWVLKAAIRPMVKRLDSTFDESSFGYASFTELLEALDQYIAERVGEHDHELAVRADIDQQTVPEMASLGSTSAALVERQLRRRGLRLPADRQVIWEVPDLIVAAFSASSGTTEPSFASLRDKLEPEAAKLGLTLSEPEFNKLKGMLWRARAFELHGRDKGISLQLPDLLELRTRIVRMLLQHLADPANEDPAALTEAFFGPRATDEQDQLVRQVLAALPADHEAEAGPDGADEPDVADEPGGAGGGEPD